MYLFTFVGTEGKSFLHIGQYLVTQLIDNLNELRHSFAYLEKFSLNISSSSFEGLVNLLHP